MTDADLRDIGGVPASAGLVRVVVGLDALITLLVGLVLLIVPTTVGQWVGLRDSGVMSWPLQAFGAALIALAGMMWLVRRAGDHPMLGVAAVLAVCQGLTVALVVMMPGSWTAIRWVTIGVFSVFVVAYAVLLYLSRRP